jgi:hypothetical protein
MSDNELKKMAKALIKKYGDCVIGNPNWELKEVEDDL